MKLIIGAATISAFVRRPAPDTIIHIAEHTAFTYIIVDCVTCSVTENECRHHTLSCTPSPADAHT